LSRLSALRLVVPPGGQITESQPLVQLAQQKQTLIERDARTRKSTFKGLLNDGRKG
jgi:hypothetical protein